jgi:O-antigen/teichoic acid export membrane protein
MMVLTGAALVWRYLPAGSAAPRFRSNLLKESWRFAVGVSGITVTFTLIFSGDKLVLSKVLDLESLGYYVIASQVAAGISTVYYPIFQSFYPKLSQMVAVPNAVQVAQLFHTFAQLLAMVMLPCLAVIWIFGDTVLFFWSHDAHLFKEVTPILLPLTLGYVPYKQKNWRISHQMERKGSRPQPSRASGAEGWSKDIQAQHQQNTGRR